MRRASWCLPRRTDSRSCDPEAPARGVSVAPGSLPCGPRSRRPVRFRPAGSRPRPKRAGARTRGSALLRRGRWRSFRAPCLLPSLGKEWIGAGPPARRPVRSLSGLPDDHSIASVDLLDLDGDNLGSRGRHVLADEIGLDRQLAMSTIDEDRKLDRAWAAIVHEGVQRGADGASGVEHVVDEDDVGAVDVPGQRSLVKLQDLSLKEIIAI